MMSSDLVQFDRDLFVRINSDWTNGFTDWFFPMVTDLHVSLYFLILLAACFTVWIYKARIEALKWIVAIVLSVALSDLIAYRVIKANFSRPRPPAAAITIVVRGPTHTGNSFPSNHSANMFAAASTVAALSIPYSVPLFIAASLIAYSRVYVGAHFPLDVVGGAILGILAAALVQLVLRRWLKRVSSNTENL